MSDLSSTDLDRSFLFGQRAMELMKAYRSSATPRSYAVWYTYVAGLNSQLIEAVKRLTAEHGTLADTHIDQLFETYLDGRKLSVETERASTGVLAEIEQIMEMLDAALGSTARYGASLQAFTQDLAAPAVNRARVREIVSSSSSPPGTWPRTTAPSRRGCARAATRSRRCARPWRRCASSR